MTPPKNATPAGPLPSTGGGGHLGVALELVLLALLFAVHFWGVKATNMGGYEWPNLHLASRGIIDYPHANRPLTLLWFLPPALLWPQDLRGFLVFEWAYLLGGAAVLYALLRFRAPAWPELALLASAFVLTWVPMDHARLQATVIVGYAGTTLVALGLMLLFLYSWRRESRLFLAISAFGALGLSRIAEAVIPLLAGAPLLLWPLRPWTRLRAWLLAWLGALLTAVVLSLPGALGRADSYQASLRFDPHPLRMLERLGLQFSFHLGPLFRGSWAELAAPSVPLAALVFGLLWWQRARVTPELGGRPSRSLVAVLLGLVFAGLGYAAFVAAAAFVTPVRTQILSGPGIAVALASSLFLLSAALPARLRALAIGALGAWVVAVGTARTLTLQRDWDRHGRFPAQRALLSQLVAQAPDVRPHTLFLLIDDQHTFPAVFSFRHAVEYMYARRASGLAWDVPDLFYPYSFAGDGLHIEPLEALRRPWDDPPTVYRYDELVVVARGPGGLRVLENWPSTLPPLPAGARYEPRTRVVSEDPRLPARSLLLPR